MVLAFFLSSALTDRIRSLEQAARSISAGELQTRVEVQGRDEISLLGNTFNQMSAQLQNAANQKQELEQLRSDLIAWVSHDLQTPLTSVRAIVEALADGVADDPQVQQRYLRTAQRDIQSLSILIDDLFQMAQLDAGGIPLDREWGSITDLISDTLESFRQLASQHQINLQGQADSECDPVNMDIQRVGRVLNNLVSNAIRHTPPGGSVTVNAARQEENVVVCVEDSGEGITIEDLPYVFDRFYRGEKSRSRNTGGAGLGLAIARGIVEAHGGRIWAESQAHKGTRITFSLPCTNC